jgi:ParB family chromosome partitioning protein
VKKPQLQNLPIDLLTRGKFQPRRQFAEEALTELAESIRSSGLIQPIIVRPLADKQYEIVAGERRWRAAQLAGLTDVPCLINFYTDEQTAAVTTIENVNRVDLNPIEEARAYQRLVDDFGYLHDEIAAVVGKSRVKITNILRLLKLDSRVQQLLITGELSEGHGKLLASLPEEKQFALAERCIQKAWSVRKLEEVLKQLTKPVTAMQAMEDVNINALENAVSEQVGSEVKLEHDAIERSGWLKIKYYNPEILAGILDRLGIKYESL